MTEGTDSSIKMLAAALEKEEKGRDFYKEAVSKCSNELGKEMFRMLMADEGVHIKRIKDIYSTLKGGQGWPEYKSHQGQLEDLQKLITQRIEKLGPKVAEVGGDIEALDIGIEMEQGAIKFYDEHLAKATNPLEQDFIALMLGEERGHFAALNDLKQYLEHPDDWFIEKERHGLDGG